MARLRALLAGPWRAVPVLGTTQILAWGILVYTPVLIVPLVAAERGWSMTFGMSGLSLALLAAGLISPRVGALVDRYGGHRVMPVGNLAGAAAIACIPFATHPIAYLGTWSLLGIAMGATLYDTAFATLGRIFGAQARPAITAVTLAGGFASTVSWPVTQALLAGVGWRATYWIYAALLAFVAAPLHAFLLPRDRAAHAPPPTGTTVTVPPVYLVASGTAFVLIAVGFAAFAFVPSALSAHLLTLLQRHGIDVQTAVLLGALFGPAQVVARICEFVFARNVHPLTIARCALALFVSAFAVLLVFGVSTPSAAAFVTLCGMSNGLMTIARGTVPLALFGPLGYGRILGRIAGPALLMQAAAPVVLALVMERIGNAVALALIAAWLVAALTCFLAVRAPRPT